MWKSSPCESSEFYLWRGWTTPHTDVARGRRCVLAHISVLSAASCSAFGGCAWVIKLTAKQRNVRRAFCAPDTRGRRRTSPTRRRQCTRQHSDWRLFNYVHMIPPGVNILCYVRKCVSLIPRSVRRHSHTHTNTRELRVACVIVYASILHC